MKVARKSRHCFPRGTRTAPNGMGILPMRRNRRGIGQVNPVTDANIVSTPTDFLRNILPTWLGGQPLTANQLAQIQAQYTQTIQLAATDPNTGITNTDLANSETQQMLGETTGVQQQAQTAAENQDTPDWLQFLEGLGGSGSGGSGGPTISSTLETLLIIAAVGVGGYLIIQLVKD